MKLNVAYPIAGTQRIFEVDDERKLNAFYEKRISQEVDGEVLGDEFKGYVFRITGGIDKQGFPMKQGVLVKGRVKLLLHQGDSGYRVKRKGAAKRRSVRGCIVGSDLKTLHLVIVKKGPGELEKLTDSYNPRRLGPKRANHIRKAFGLSKEDDVRKYVVHRKIEREGKKPIYKGPKIQRLVTPRRLHRKRAVLNQKRTKRVKARAEAKAYAELLANHKR